MKNTPRTRFVGFNESWQHNQLGNLVKFANGKAHEKNIDAKGSYVVINSKFISSDGLVYKTSNKNLSPLEKGDIVMVMSDVPKGRALAKCYLIDENDKYTLNQRICALKAKKIDNGYLYYYLNRNKYFLLFDNGVGQTNLKKDEVLDCPVMLPSLAEQRKISFFLTLLDQKINKQQKKVEQLELFQQGLIQKIFSQGIRFKDDIGHEFPEWGKSSLEELGDFKKSYSFSRALEGEGEYHHIHYGDIHSKYEGIMGSETQFPSITIEGPLEVIEDKDLIFADASEDYKDLGKAVVVWGLDNKLLVAGLHTHRFKPNKNVDSRFLMYFTKTKSYEVFIKKQGTGISVLGISKKNLLNLKVPLPSLKEQKKIASFLISIDNKIEKEQERLKTFTKLKKGLIQQMFI